MSARLRETVTERVHCASMSIEWKRVALVAVLAVGSSCAVPSRAPLPPAAVPTTTTEDGANASVTSPVVLVTIDGVRWQEVFEGTDTGLSHAPFRPSRRLVPNLDRLMRERGAA